MNGERPLMTLRVSRDSGKTFGPRMAVTAKKAAAPLMSSAWPPCECQRCVRP